MKFNEYVIKEAQKVTNLNESFVQFGKTSVSESDNPLIIPHQHDYLINPLTNYGQTGPADKGIAHWHQIIDGKIIDGDHTHTLLAPTAEGDELSGIGDTTGINMPVKIVSQEMPTVKAKKKVAAKKAVKKAVKKVADAVVHDVATKEVKKTVKKEASKAVKKETKKNK